MKFVVFLAFALLGWSDALGIDTVPALNVTQYLGRWYQVFKQSLHIIVLCVKVAVVMLCNIAAIECIQYASQRGMRAKHGMRGMRSMNNPNINRLLTVKLTGELFKLT